MKTGITFLASSSAGNSLVIHAGGEGVMIDAGINGDMLDGLLKSELDPKLNIRGLLVTHEHGDHVRGMHYICTKHGIPAIMTPALYEEIKNNLRGVKVLLCQKEERFSLGHFEILAFPVPHDTVDPVGYSIQFNNMKFGIATDLGEVDSAAERHMLGSDVLALESNHDLDMLKSSQRPRILKDRIKSSRGHLSNVQASEALGKILSGNTKRLFLLHLSQECNTAEKVDESVKARLEELGRKDIEYHIVNKGICPAKYWI